CTSFSYVLLRLNRRLQTESTAPALLREDAGAHRRLARSVEAGRFFRSTTCSSHPSYTETMTPAILARLWEAQTAALAVKNTGMAVTADISGVRDIHPRNRRDVGKRLALWALAKDYGKQGIVYSGPLYKTMSVEGGAIRLSFDHTGSGLTARDGKDLTWFEIAGSDKQFVPAKAVIDGDTVVVSSEKVADRRRQVRVVASGRAQPEQQGGAAGIAF
ncbi:MAG: hypothetical protein MZV70_05450, partial [Desulfobacterales bacterium]|nr:hypothetical protein [Desulfobacterales bacterium]